MLWLAHSALVYGAICFFKHWRPMQQARVQSPRCHSTGWYNIHASCWNNVPRPGARHSHTRWAQSNTHMSIHPSLIYSICCFCRHSYRRKSIKGKPLQSSWGRCGTSIIVFHFFGVHFVWAGSQKEKAPFSQSSRTRKLAYIYRWWGLHSLYLKLSSFVGLHLISSNLLDVNSCPYL